MATVHDWTLVDAGIFHDFHTVWTVHLRTALNRILPRGYYALAEQHAGAAVADVLTLHGDSAPIGRDDPEPPTEGGTLVAEKPPRVRQRQTLESTAAARRRSIAIRHVSGDRLIALLEIVSPANKDRLSHVQEFAKKVRSALELGVHLLVIDLFSPGRHDPRGMHGAILDLLGRSDVVRDYSVPEEEPLTLASYAAGVPNIEIYLEHLAVGAAILDMPLFLSEERYIDAPLNVTYESAFLDVPMRWREVLEDRVAD